MDENKKIEIALSKSKLAKLLLFSVLFMCGGLWILITNPQTGNPLFNNMLVRVIASYGGIIMGLLGIIFFGKKLFDNKPGFVIDEKGIYDNASAFAFGFIPWEDISGIYERTVQAPVASKQHFVTIGLVHPDKYIAGEKNFLKRKFLSASIRSYGSPIHIPTNGLEIHHNQLLKILTGEFAKHKSQHG